MATLNRTLFYKITEKTRLKAEQDDARFADLTHILLDQAVLSEGGQLDDPAAFVHKLNGLLQGLLN